MLLVFTKEEAYAQIGSACTQLFATFKFLFSLCDDALCKFASVIDDSRFAFESAGVLQAFLWKKEGSFLFIYFSSFLFFIPSAAGSY